MIKSLGVMQLKGKKKGELRHEGSGRIFSAKVGNRETRFRTHKQKLKKMPRLSAA